MTRIPSVARPHDVDLRLEGSGCRTRSPRPAVCRRAYRDTAAARQGRRVRRRDGPVWPDPPAREAASLLGTTSQVVDGPGPERLSRPRSIIGCRRFPPAPRRLASGGNVGDRAPDLAVRTRLETVDDRTSAETTSVPSRRCSSCRMYARKASRARAGEPTMRAPVGQVVLHDLVLPDVRSSGRAAPCEVIVESEAAIMSRGWPASMIMVALAFNREMAAAPPAGVRPLVQVSRRRPRPDRPLGGAGGIVPLADHVRRQRLSGPPGSPSARHPARSRVPDDVGGHPEPEREPPAGKRRARPQLVPLGATAPLRAAARARREDARYLRVRPDRAGPGAPGPRLRHGHLGHEARSDAARVVRGRLSRRAGGPGRGPPARRLPGRDLSAHARDARPPRAAGARADEADRGPRQRRSRRDRRRGRRSVPRRRPAGRRPSRASDASTSGVPVDPTGAGFR